MATNNMTVSNNDITPLLIGGPVVYNAVAETVAQDVSSIIPAGTILGRINLSTGVAGSIVQANPTHNGTGVITLDSVNPCQTGCRQGVYTITFTGATSGYVTDPSGFQIGAAFTSLPNPWTYLLKFVITGTPAAGDVSTITVPAVVVTNASGSQVITMDATTPVLYGAKAGNYQVVFTSATAGYVNDPNGNAVGGPFTSLPNPFANELKFVPSGTIAGGNVSNIFICAGTGKLKRFVSTNFDGSQVPEFILLSACDATTGDVVVGRQGEPNAGPVVLLKVGTVNANLLVLQNEPLQSYIPLLNMKVVDALTQAGFTVQSVYDGGYFDN